MDLTLDSRVRRRPEPLFGDIDGQIVILAADGQRYHHLNGSATRIFELLEAAEARPVRWLCDQLQREYAVARERLEREVLAALGTLVARGLASVDG